METHDFFSLVRICLPWFWDSWNGGLEPLNGYDLCGRCEGRIEQHPEEKSQKKKSFWYELCEGAGLRAYLLLIELVWLDVLPSWIHVDVTPPYGHGVLDG